jgi:ammonia channel protein AmtB
MDEGKPHIPKQVSKAFMHANRFLKYLDDSLDVFLCHGMGGTLGALLTGCFASLVCNVIMMKSVLTFEYWTLRK